MYKNLSFECGNASFKHISVTFSRSAHFTDSCHAEYEILFFFNCSGEYNVEGNVGELMPGTLLFIKPFEYLKLSPVLKTRYEYCSVRFTRASIVQDTVDLFDSLVSRDLTDRILMCQNINIPSLFERMEAAHEMQPEERAVYFKIILSELIVLLSRSDAFIVGRARADLGARVVKYINENLDRPLTLDMLAERFFVSKYYLCRAFKAYNGISVHSYINIKRVTFAKSLIESGESAASAAYKVGFGDYSAFYRAYVKIVGSAPTKIKDANTNKSKAIFGGE